MKVGKCQQKEEGGKKGMKSGDPRHIFIEKREEIQSQCDWIVKRDKDELTLGFSPITYYPMKHIG